MTERKLLPGIEDLLEDLHAAAADIPPARQDRLRDISTWIRSRAQEGTDAPLIFICTHNSRRSHLSQLWAQALAWKHGLDHVRTYSGGTEATALHPNAVAALRGCGFEISGDAEAANPRHTVCFAEDAEAVTAWSKTFGDPANPAADFAAVMTCNDADEACPFVPGAAARFSLPYEDPKQSDGSGREAEVYRARSLEIAGEMLFLIETYVAGFESTGHPE